MADEKLPTRYYSDKQETAVAQLINGQKVSGSGSGLWKKGDVINVAASLVVECKTTTKPKKSCSIQKEWIDKNEIERRTNHLSNSAIAVNFEPGKENYFVINERLFKFLVEKLTEEESKLAS